MQRLFTDSIGRFPAGAIRDFPKQVWSQIARSAGKPLDEFTVAIENVSQYVTSTVPVQQVRQGRPEKSPLQGVSEDLKRTLETPESFPGVPPPTPKRQERQGGKRR